MSGKPVCRLFIWGACILLFGCGAPPPITTRMEAAAPPPERNPAPESVPIVRNPAPPKPREVREAVSRIFHQVVAVESERKPNFLVGDFNGDGSQDLVVIVKPAAGNLSLINNELASWTLVDPFRTAKQQRIRVDENDELLAIIHGFGSSGWRHSQATQTYVLRAASALSMRVRPRNQILKPDNKDRLPRLRGDVIEGIIGGQSGFFYYNGATYGWYDPHTYEPSPPLRTVHGEVGR